MSNAPKAVDLHPGARGFVSGVVNAQLNQRVLLEVKRKSDNTQIASATFEGQGSRIHLRDIFNNREYWSFGPFTFEATLHITISHHRNGVWNGSRSVGPLTIQKNPEPDYPLQFFVSTVISEDGDDASHDDCSVNVLQYK